MARRWILKLENKEKSWNCTDMNRYMKLMYILVGNPLEVYIRGWKENRKSVHWLFSFLCKEINNAWEKYKHLNKYPGTYKIN